MYLPLFSTTETYRFGRLKDKNGFTVLDLVSKDDTAILTAIRKARASNAISHSDIAIGEYLCLFTTSFSSPTGLVDDDDEEDSGSGSDSD